MTLGNPKYAYAKLCEAEYELAIGPGDIRSRLINAYNKFYILAPADFPANLSTEYDLICNKLNEYECPPILQALYGTHPNVGYTMNKIKNKAGVDIAEKIILLKSQLRDCI